MLDDNDTTTPDTSAAPADSGETAGSAEPGPAAPVAKKVTRKRAVKKTVTKKAAAAPADEQLAMPDGTGAEVAPEASTGEAGEHPADAPVKKAAAKKAAAKKTTAKKTAKKAPAKKTAARKTAVEDPAAPAPEDETDEVAQPAPEASPADAAADSDRRLPIRRRPAADGGRRRDRAAVQGAGPDQARLPQEEGPARPGARRDARRDARRGRRRHRRRAGTGREATRPVTLPLRAARGWRCCRRPARHRRRPLPLTRRTTPTSPTTSRAGTAVAVAAVDAAAAGAAATTAPTTAPTTPTTRTPVTPPTRPRSVRTTPRAVAAVAATGNQGNNQRNGGQNRGGGEAKDDDQGDGNGTRRRRRRRRAGEEGDSGGDDPEKTVTRVRKARSAEDEITSLQGSTRLEAKKQRRREGREAGRRRAPIVSEAEFLARREAVDRVMVIRQRKDLTQIAVLEDKVLVEHYVARESQTSLIGNVYLGRVQNVLPSMEAAFVDIGKGRNAVLYAGEVNWDALGAGNGPRKIEQVLKSGQPILVQVTKDPIGHKGARLTSQISLPGRFLVYVPDGTTSGISRKLPDTERNRLKTLLKEIVPDSAGVIVRTAAEGASEDELTRDVERLTARWTDIEGKIEKGNAPQLLYGEPDLTLKVVRDLFTEDFARLVVSGDDAWDMVDSYVEHVAPDLADRLERYSGNDVFGDYRIDEQIAKGLDRKVWLPSGGSLIIDRTEAMTVVDVNTGKFTGSGGNLEETVTKNNLEAAEEMVRQLRLRDIGGIIVVDFIDMVLESNRDLVLRRLVECLGRDRTRHQVAEVTSLGLVQMTRKRIGTGLLEAFSETCDHCQGRGLMIQHEPVEPRKQQDDEPRRGRRGRGRGAGDTGDDSNGNGWGPGPEGLAVAQGHRRDRPARAQARRGRVGVGAEGRGRVTQPLLPRLPLRPSRAPQPSRSRRPSRHPSPRWQRSRSRAEPPEPATATAAEPEPTPEPALSPRWQPSRSPSRLRRPSPSPCPPARAWSPRRVAGSPAARRGPRPRARRPQPRSRSTARPRPWATPATRTASRVLTRRPRAVARPFTSRSRRRVRASADPGPGRGRAARSTYQRRFDPPGCHP